jgi:murein DD-endopeptidase MepM/ murein hydrolase activator NlpD
MHDTQRRPLRPLAAAAALALLAGCTTESFDWDLRPQGQGSTAQAALAATRERPLPDSRGVLSYPGYQVALARRGDTVASVAARVGLDAGELARANALRPEDALREGEILALPRRVAEPAPGAPGSGIPAGGRVIGGSGGAAGGAAGGAIDVTTLAGAAIDRAAPPAAGSAAPRPAPAGPEPVRHRVARGETAFSVARLYGVSPRALADWNGLGPDLALREGQTLLIPTAAGSAPPAPAETEPGAGSPTPVPPSAAKPLPAEKPAPAAAPAAGVPASPDLGAQRTGSGAALAMPVQGKIIRGYAKGKNDGIDIAAAPGTAVVAAADGTVAAITKDTGQVPILVIRHPDNLLTVYAGIDAVSLAKGAKVSRGQKIAVIRQAEPAFLHFEVRKGVESVDPLGYLQ